MDGFSAGAEAVDERGAFLLKGLEEGWSVAILWKSVWQSVSQSSDICYTTAIWSYMVLVLSSYIGIIGSGLSCDCSFLSDGLCVLKGDRR